MKHRKILLSILVIVFVLACNIPAPTFTPTPAGNTTTTTPTATSTLLPAATFTPIGSTVPFAAPNDGALNCRSGPGTNFDVMVILAATQSAEIAGKNPEGTWWYVKNPYIAGNFCWVITTFVNTVGDLSKLQVVGVPATPANPASAVIAVDLSISPDTIHIAGCTGPGQSVTVNAKIQTNGPMQIKAHFSDEEYGDLPSHTLNFNQAGVQDISDTFTPPVIEGKHRIFLFIEGFDLSDLNTRKPYLITC